MISPLRKLEKKRAIESWNWDILEANFWSKIQNPIWIHFSIIQNSTAQYWDNSYLRQNYFNDYWRTEIKTILSIFLKHSIKVYWKRKSYLSWGGFDQKVLLPNWVSLETRHQNCAEHQQWRIRCLQAVKNHFSPSLQTQSISPNKKAAAYPAIIALSSESFQIQEYFVEKCFRSCSHSLRQCSCGSARLNTPWQNMRWR